MRIQEMRSTKIYLIKAADSGVSEKLPDDPLAEIELFQASPHSAEDAETKSSADVDSELDRRCWAVVSFSQIEADGLTYREAAELIIALDQLERTGLCIITDTAAARLET